MTHLHKNQEKILDLLLDSGDGLTLAELSDRIGISKSAVKEHLLKLDAFGYIRYEDSKGGVGRPKRRYLLTSEGQEAFPKQYSWLSSSLLEYLLEDIGTKATAEMMDGLAEKIHGSMRHRFEGKATFAELIAELGVVLNELGYRARVTQSDLRKGAVIEATHCVYHSVAKEHPALCQFDISFIGRSTDTEVEMQSCIAKGGSVCRFCLTRK